MHPVAREKEILQIADQAARAAVNGDGIASLANVIQHGLVLDQLRAQLVEISDLKIRTLSYRPAIRLQLTDQDAQQRGLARTVRADNANLVAALDGGGKIAQHRPFPKSIA